MRRRFLPFLLLLCSVLAGPAAAQSVRWEPAGGTLAVGQTTELSLIFVDCEPTGEVTLPALPNLSLGRPSRGEQSSFNIVNGQSSRTRTVFLTYSAMPSAKAPIEIPAFTVQTDKGPQRVAGVSFQVGDATVGSSMPLDAAANSRLALADGPVWAGEVIPVNYTLSVTNRFPANIGSNPNWDPAPLVHEEWAQPEPFNSVVNGDNRNNVLYKARGYIREPGSYTLGAVTQLVNLRVPTSGFSIFQSFQAEQFNITSNRPSIVVRPLPQPAPANFAGAVGEFTLVSKVVPQKAVTSEPITWTLELAGVGNWPDIAGMPAREASRDFRVVQPQAKRTQAQGSLFEATLSEDVVLIPTKPGTYTLGPVIWTYFDPKSGTYKTLTTERVSVTVEAPASDPVATTAPAVTLPDAIPTPGATLPGPPAPPAAIPLDPIAGIAEAPTPLSRTGLAVAMGAALAWLPLVWLGLAWRHARRHDPWKERRDARRRLGQTLAALRSATNADARFAGLRTWQQESARLWGLARAVPTARHFASSPEWTRLWDEAERSLYGSASALPEDWIARAEAALNQHRVPAFSWLSLFSPRHLLPFVAVVLFAALPRAEAADAGAAAYGRSEFAAAEQIWREALTRRPTDWIAHHNLALALAQQDRWNEAAGHATAAFVQNPGHPSVRWHFELALTRAGYAPADLVAFARPGPLHQIARWLSPAEWERVLLGAMALLGAAGACGLLVAYGHRSRLLPLAAGLFVITAIVASVAAALSLQGYGLATDARAAVVWHATTLRSIPTEADTAQKTSPLAPGSMAVIDRRFLGWIRLAFPDGQTGWVRNEDVVRLYR